MRALPVSEANDDPSRSDRATLAPGDSEAARDKYLRETVRVWLGVQRDAGVDIAPLPAPLARLLLRMEEYERPLRDTPLAG